MNLQPNPANGPPQAVVVDLVNGLAERVRRYADIVKSIGDGCKRTMPANPIAVINAINAATLGIASLIHDIQTAAANDPRAN